VIAIVSIVVMIISHREKPKRERKIIIKNKTNNNQKVKLFSSCGVVEISSCPDFFDKKAEMIIVAIRIQVRIVMLI